MKSISGRTLMALLLAGVLLFGLLTFVIRRFGAYNEGVAYSILIMNLLVPYINAKFRRTPMGGGTRS